MSANDTWTAFDDEMAKLGAWTDIFRRRKNLSDVLWRADLKPAQRAALEMHMQPGYTPKVAPDMRMLNDLQQGGTRNAGPVPGGSLEREIRQWTSLPARAGRWASGIGQQAGRGVSGPKPPPTKLRSFEASRPTSNPRPAESRSADQYRWPSPTTWFTRPSRPRDSKIVEASVMSALTHPATLGAGLGAGGVALGSEIESLLDPREQQKTRGERAKELALGAGIGAVVHPALTHLLKRGFNEELAKVAGPAFSRAFWSRPGAAVRGATEGTLVGGILGSSVPFWADGIEDTEENMFLGMQGGAAAGALLGGALGPRVFAAVGRGKSRELDRLARKKALSRYESRQLGMDPGGLDLRAILKDRGKSGALHAAIGTGLGAVARGGLAALTGAEDIGSAMGTGAARGGTSGLAASVLSNSERKSYLLSLIGRAQKGDRAAGMEIRKLQSISRRQGMQPLASAR
jgi:hypothetical protein